MFGGNATGWMAGTLIWMPCARWVRAGQTYPLRCMEFGAWSKWVGCLSSRNGT